MKNICNDIYDNVNCNLEKYNQEGYNLETIFKQINILVEKKPFLTLKSNNLKIYDVGKNKTLLVYEKCKRKNYNSLYEVNNNILIEIPQFTSSNIYNNISYYNIYLHNLTNTIISGLGEDYFNTITNNTIYCINLDKRTDRWKNILRYDFKYFKIERFPAINTQRNMGWEGCAHSHMKLISYAKDNNLQYIIVAEDDFINIIHNRLWEIRLITIINWLLLNLDKWEIFNGMPMGDNMSINLIDKNAGIIQMKGGYNTHFMIYNLNYYDKLIKWFSDYDPVNQFKNEIYPDLSKNSPSYNQSLTIDLWLSNNMNIITSFPLLTNSNNDDSDIITFTNQNTIVSSVLKGIILDEKKNNILELAENFLKINNNDNNNFNDTLDNFVNQLTNEKKEYEFIENFYNSDNINNNTNTQKYFNEKSQIISNFIDTYKFIKYCELLYGKLNLDNTICDYGNNGNYGNNDVSVIILSKSISVYNIFNCIESFYKYNSYKVQNIYIVDINNNNHKQKIINEKFNFVKYHVSNKTIYLDTIKDIINNNINDDNIKYIFVASDEWTFEQSFFIEQSKLLTQDNIVSLYDINLKNNFKYDNILLPQINLSNNIFYWKFKDNINLEINNIFNECFLIKYDIFKDIVLNNKEYFLENIIIAGGYLCRCG